MKINSTAVKPAQISLQITLESDDLNKYRDKAMNDLAKNVDLKGFRKGKVPVSMITQYFDEETILSRIFDLALPETYVAALKQENLNPISHPDIKVKNFDKEKKEIVFEALFAIMPEMTIGDLGKIKIAKNKVEVTKEEVEGVIKEIRKRHTEYKKAEEAKKAAIGDKVEVSFVGKDLEGKELSGTSSKKHPLILGEKMMVPGFEDNIVNMTVNEKKSFKITFPADYFRKDYRNKEVMFELSLDALFEPLPFDFTEEFLEKVSGKKMNFAAFEKDVESELLLNKKMDERKKEEVLFLEEIVKITKVDLPPQLIEQEIDIIIEDIKMEVQNKGLKFEDYLAALKKEEKDLRANVKEEAIKRITLRFALKEIFKKENIEASKDEIKKEIDLIVAYYPEKSRKEVREKYEEENSELYLRIKSKIMLDKLFNKYI